MNRIGSANQEGASMPMSPGFLMYQTWLSRTRSIQNATTGTLTAVSKTIVRADGRISPLPLKGVAEVRERPLDAVFERDLELGAGA